MKPVHRIEFFAARLFLRIFRLLSPATASNLGGLIARQIGSRLPVSRRADVNLRAALPELDDAARRAVTFGVWDNLGRVCAEFPHLSTMKQTASGPGFEIEGGAHLAAIAARGGPALFVTLHQANWEILPVALAHFGIELGFIYRAAANRAVDQLILDLRAEALGVRPKMFPKGASGARGAYAHLARGGYLCMLVDQKLNDGIEVPFFGMNAMTAPAVAAFALKFRCPIIPIHVERLGPARLRIAAEAPLTLPATGDRAADIKTIMIEVNNRLESWIRARPAEWLWLHRRWPKAETAKVK